MNAIVTQTAPATAAVLAAPAASFKAYSRLDISNEDYHADRVYESSSGLKQLLRSGAHYKHYKDTPHEDKTHFRIGTAIHAALLEPQRFQDDYIISPEFNRRTKEGREDEAKFKTEAADNNKFVVTADELVMIQGISDNVNKHQSARLLIEAGMPEKSFFWEDPETGIKCKCRTDSISQFAILDVKSTEDASPHQFVRSCVNYNYDLSAAFYREGVAAVQNDFLDFVFLVVEKKAPYSVAMYVAPAELIASGTVRMKDALSKLAKYREAGQFPSYQPDGKYEMLDWPNWAYYRS